MATRKDLIKIAAERFAEAEIAVTTKEVEWLLLEAASISLIDLISHPTADVSDAEAEKFQLFIERRMRHEPVQYILGHADFYGLRFEVNQNVLIPRPETELLVERALFYGDTRSNLVDIGTGSGCIAIAFKKRRSESTVTGVDISESAIETARRNALAHDADINWILGDLFEPSLVHLLEKASDGIGVDLLVSNPPYVRREEQSTLAAEVVSFEPHLALFARDDAMEAYHALARLGRSLLKEGGYLLVEIHADMAGPVVDTIVEAGYGDVDVISDLAGRDRLVEARI